MAGIESLKDVALRPWPANKTDEFGKDVMLPQIEQLARERGHLRNITEQSLQADIEAGKDVLDNAKEDSETEDDEKEPRTLDERKKEIAEMQMEMASHLDWARFAATNALDLISLVLSTDPNKRAPTSFSHTFREAGLNQGLPFGSVGVARENHEYDELKPPERSRREEYQKRQELVAKAARMEALDNATDEILKAAKNLEKEVRRETKYWQEIVSISNKGWPIHRMGNARHAPFGVRFGAPEASGQFKTRGSAPLRMDKDGSIILDPNLALKPKTLRVRISEGGKITGSSQLPVESLVEGLAVEKSVRLARDSLLEEELYHEMSLETRQLLPYGVRLRDNVISVDAPGANTSVSRQLLIDCIPRDDRAADGQGHANDWLAHNIAEALRLLLTHEHNMRLYRRTQLPPALTARKQEQKSPPLLRTLLAMLYHLQHVDSLFAYLITVCRTLKSAGLEAPLETDREESWIKLRDSLAKPTRRDLSATDQLLEIFSKPFTGKATLTLPSHPGSQTEQLTIAIRTVIGAPTFGTEYKLTLPAALATDLGLSTENRFQSTVDVTSYLDWILSLHIAHRVLKYEYANRASVNGNEARVTIASKGGKKGTSAKQDIALELKEGSLSVHLTNSSSQEPSQESHSWSGNEGGLSLKEQVKSWLG